MNYTWIFFSFLTIVAMLILGLLFRLKQDNREEVKNKTWGMAQAKQNETCRGYCLEQLKVT